MEECVKKKMRILGKNSCKGERKIKQKKSKNEEKKENKTRAKEKFEKTDENKID